MRGWKGARCSECDTNFGPAGLCNQCLKGWAGKNCSECATNFESPGQCDKCVIGWDGDNCDICACGWYGANCTECANNFGPPGQDAEEKIVTPVLEDGLVPTAVNVLPTGPAGQCARCLTGWIGDDCNYCEGFGFSTESNCTQCIQNGTWTGFWFGGPTGLTLHLTFDGPACNNVVPGMHKYT